MKNSMDQTAKIEEKEQPMNQSKENSLFGNIFKKIFGSAKGRSILFGLIAALITAYFDPVKPLIQYFINHFHDIYQDLAAFRDTGNYKYLYVVVGVVLTFFWGLAVEKTFRLVFRMKN